MTVLARVSINLRDQPTGLLFEADVHFLLFFPLRHSSPERLRIARSLTAFQLKVSLRPYAYVPWLHMFKHTFHLILE
jgi:hypothetical protein